MFYGLGEEGRSILTIFLVLIPVSLYGMGLMEGKKGYYICLGGIAFHLVSIAQRFMITGIIPLAEKRDNVSFMALSMALVYLHFVRKRRMPDLSLIALPFISVLLLVSLTFRPMDSISPFMNSPWFFFHMFFYFTSYGFFGISMFIGILFLVKKDRELEMMQYRAAIYGLVLFSASLVAGSIWFFVAYGTYWLWTSRELWITLMWFYYGMYLHTRLVKGLSGVPAAILGIAGFPLALFAYFGLGTVIPSPPTQF